MDSIYLDHNATTPMRPEVAEAMARCFAQGYANPASQHQPGQQARRALEEAREATAAMLGADCSGSRADRLIFTSGGTEANNLALLGLARACDDPNPGQIVVSAVEHASVFEPAARLLEFGWRVDTIPVSSDGVVCLDPFRQLLGEDTRVVSVTLGNHDTGALQPVDQLASICNEAGVPLHTDAVQVVGKLAVDFRKLGVAAMSIAAHKFRGPLGIGALLLRHDVTPAPLLYGGHQQEAIRPGTESIPLAVGMRTALELWQEEQQSHRRHLATLRDRFEIGLRAGFPSLVVNSGGTERLPQTSNVGFPGLDGQVLLMALDVAGVACSVGSACSSGSTELSPTLLAMNLPKEIVAGSLRFSLGATTTEAEIDEAVRRILHVCDELRT